MDSVAKPTLGSLKYTGHFKGPKTLLVSLNFVTIYLMLLWVPVIYKDIPDSSKFILNLALTTNVKSSVRRTSNKIKFPRFWRKRMSIQIEPSKCGFSINRCEERRISSFNWHI